MSPPPRAPNLSLGDLRSYDSVTAQFNPTDLERTVAVTYERLGIMGHSHQQLQYKWRENEKLTFELLFTDGAPGVSSLEDVQGFIDAMTLGSRSAEDIAGGGPPDVLFLWPGVLEIRCRITTVKWAYKHFSTKTGQVRWLTSKLDLEESRTNRLYAEDVVQRGLYRGEG